MGCCFSKKRRKQLAGVAVFSRRCKPAEEYRDPPPPLPEEEKVKEVLSETPVRAAEVKLAANVAVLEEPEVEKPAPPKPKPSADADAPTVSVSDLGSCMSASLATDDRSEAASESSVATSSVAGPEWSSPGKPPARKRRPVSVSGELGHVHSRRDRAAAYGVRSRSARASASPPPRRDQRDRSVRRSPSPAAKRPSEQQRRSPSPAASSHQRKPPVPARPSPRRVQESPPPPQPEEDAMAADGELSIADAAGAGGNADGKESLDNPLVSLECFIFL
uniref:Uncharacterized protein n=1 Tax=Leersia perrieri TaxID=77586 RepID=A0A0D9V6H2_9ORYZ